MKTTGRPLGPYLVVAGATAVGKSAVALEVADRVGGEIVIADSRQVFRGIDIATAKPSPSERKRVRHHLLDRIGIGTPYSAADYARDARAAIADIQSRGGTAIVCGGTGFYLAALAGGLDPVTGHAPSAERRAARARLRSIPAERRHAALATVDPASARRLHPNDRQRVSHALETYYLAGEPLSALQTGGGALLAHCAVRLTRSRAETQGRIAARLGAMLAAGLEEEARLLWEAGHSPTEPGLQTIGIQEWWPFFRGAATREATCGAILAATRAYAKRQETWFRNQGDYRPVPAADGAAGVLAVWEVNR
ncbi:tRNA (adenosine(37)-N6)-dimethylallyltransferase MiaA [soil metagenome]